MANDKSDLTSHNQHQVSYFEATTKQTMLPGFTPYIRRQADKLLECTGIGSGERVLEVGCGMGRHTFYLAEKGIKIEGLDLTPGLLDKLREFDGGRYNIPVYCEDVQDFAAQSAGQYDAVIGFFVLHHLYDLSRAFQAMAKLVKPGGCLAFIEPNPYNPLYYLQITLTPGMSWQAERGILNMRRSILFPAMEAAHLTNLTQRRFGFFPRFITNRTWGIQLEDQFEKAGILHPIRPFQFFGAQL